MKLRQEPGVDFRKGRLVVRYQAPNDQKAEIFAEKELILK